MVSPVVLSVCVSVCLDWENHILGTRAIGVTWRIRVNDERAAAVVPDHFVGLLLTLAARRDAIVVTY